MLRAKIRCIVDCLVSMGEKQHFDPEVCYIITLWTATAQEPFAREPDPMI